MLRFRANTPYDYDRFIIAMSTTGYLASPHQRYRRSSYGID
ncbi:MAG: hypothetical protein V7L23_25670 [Nostoc sp.]